MTSPVIQQWHRLVAEKNSSGLGDILADNAVFHSPVVHTPQEGKAITQKYLTVAFDVLFNESFQYMREIIGERDAMLEFSVELDGIMVNGVDLIQWNDQNEIVDFKVMIRSLKAIDVVRERMMQGLQAETQ